MSILIANNRLLSFGFFIIIKQSNNYFKWIKLYYIGIYCFCLIGRCICRLSYNYFIYINLSNMEYGNTSFNIIFSTKSQFQYYTILSSSFCKCFCKYIKFDLSILKQLEIIMFICRWLPLPNKFSRSFISSELKPKQKLHFSLLKYVLISKVIFKLNCCIMHFTINFNQLF